VMMQHKGRSRLSVKVCKCGRLALKCKYINGKKTHCKNRPRLCGYCAIHCEKSRKRKVRV
jgi:hypothetical protein